MKKQTFLKPHKVWRRLLLVVLCAALMAGQTIAAENAEDADYDGYLVRLAVNPYIRTQLIPQGAELVCNDINLYHVSTREELLALEEQGLLLSAEPNYLVELLELPEDPCVSQQWELDTLGVEAAWSAGLNGSGVRIGIIDSGCMVDHPDLAEAEFLTGYDYVNKDTTVEDTVGHGTFVTGVIAAQHNNEIGTAGLAPGAQIVPLKCFEGNNAPISGILSALWDSVDVYGCQIINMSFGIRVSSTELQAAVEHVLDAGAIVTAAVGNDGQSISYYPAAYEGVIGVGSVDMDLQCSSFSQRNASVFVTAPGRSLCGLSTNGEYTSGRGTSYSCPMVTATAALMLQMDSALTALELREYLAASSQDLGDAGRDDLYGYGLVQIDSLMEMVSNGSPVHSYSNEITTPTCDTGGYTMYTCAVCGDSYVDDETDALGHNYSDISCVWSEENTMCTVTISCACGDSLTAIAESAYEVVKPATEAEKGEGKYNASVELDGKTYNISMTVEIPVLSHTHEYGEVVFAWDTYYSGANATIKCCDIEGGSISDFETASVVVDNGKLIFAVKITLNGVEYTDTKDIEVVDNGDGTFKLMLPEAKSDLLVMIAGYDDSDQMISSLALGGMGTSVDEETVFSIAGDAIKVFFLDAKTYEPVIQSLSLGISK